VVLGRGPSSLGFFFGAKSSGQIPEKAGILATAVPRLHTWLRVTLAEEVNRTFKFLIHRSQATSLIRY
jgi:hypothetical protein